MTVLIAALAATLVTLSARLRTGAEAALYVGLAWAAEAAVVAPLFVVPRHALPAAGTLAAVITFFALRAFGETLARYDPLPEPAG